MCYKKIKETNNLTNTMQLKSYVEGQTEKKPAWYNSFNFELVKNNIKDTILNIITNDKSKRVIGFKEIRYLIR